MAKTPARGHQLPWLALSLSLLALTGCGANTHAATTNHPTHVATTDHPTSALVPIGAGLDGPAGLHASIYAKGPRTLASFAFDSQGRLWLTGAGLETHTVDGVYLISQPGGTAQRVVSGLDDPLGLYWYRGKLYIASVGRVDAYWDFNGKQFTQHQLILKGPLTDGENNLLIMAPNGRFLMGVSATCDHCTPTSKWDGAIVSFLPNGSDLRVYAKRVRAPFALAYRPGTKDLFVTMDQRDDLGTATPGEWLGLVREGQDWGFPECYGQGGPACAGIPEPVATLDKHGAIGGIAFANGQLGPTIGAAAIIAEWNIAKVQQVSLTKTSTGYHATVTPFLTGMERPLAVVFAPDHSLLVGDWATGTIYSVTYSG